MLDWLRAVGALAVLTTHVAFQTGEYSRHGTVGTMLARLDVGVALFFVLSGFLLSRAWWARDAAGPAQLVNTRRYAIKRVLRIMPVYVVTAWSRCLPCPATRAAAGSWVADPAGRRRLRRRQLPQGLTQMWSLAAEVAFYVVLPLLMWVARRRVRGVRSRQSRSRHPRARQRGLGAVWIVPAIADLRDWAPNLWLPGYLAWFAAGMWLAREHVRRQQAGLCRGPAACSPSSAPSPASAGRWQPALFLVAATPVAGPVSLEPGTVSQALVKNALYAGSR